MPASSPRRPARPGRPSPSDMPGAVTASATKPVQQSTIDMHRGNMLVYVANTYETLPKTILEGIQNGFDAEADRILVCIDLKSREVLILDNGEGTTREQFDEALNNVGYSLKNRDRKRKKTKLGQFGLGLLSPLTKCTSYTFTSSPRGTRQALRWTFRLADIVVQKESVTIPRETLSQLPAMPRRFAEYATGEFQQDWRTIVHLRGVITDRVSSNVDLDDLAFNIRTKFMAPMRERKAVVRLVLFDSENRKSTLDVNPLHYNGEPLPVANYHDDDTGLVVFELYRARRVGGQRRGQVSVMATDSNYPLPMQDFLRQARGRGHESVITDAMTALSSGHFEGLIKCGGIELHPDRNKFVYNDALEMFYLVLDQWYDDYGRVQYQSEQDVSRHTRWQELGLKTLALMQERQHQPLWERLFENLRDIVTLGRLGVGHLPPQQGLVDGPDDDPSLRVGQGNVGEPRNRNGETGPERPPRNRPGAVDRPGDIPKTAAGPAGQRRRLVHGDSQGLQLAHAEWPGDSRLWDFDFLDGTITFNTLHPVWGLLDETNGKHTQKNSRWIMQLQELIIVKVLNLLLHCPDHDEFERRRAIADTEIRPNVEAFITHTTLRA